MHNLAYNDDVQAEPKKTFQKYILKNESAARGVSFFECVYESGGERRRRTPTG
jgi:hypothetical protein